MGVLRALGLNELEEQVYELLVERASATPPELATALDVAEDHVHGALRELADRGLAVALVGEEERFTASAPEPALDALVFEQERVLATVRAHAQELSARARRAAEHRRPAELVAVVVGKASLNASFEQLQRSAVREVLTFDRPPYPASGGNVKNELGEQRQREGIVYRTIYDASVLDDPGVLARVTAEVANGEKGRVLAGVPLKLSIADRTMALLPLLHADEWNEHATLVIQPSVLLDSLVALFEALWARAVPFATAREGLGVDPELVEVVSLLATGMTDERMARHLGTSDRTVRRRIAAALDALGAKTRFQAGLRAVQAGWIPSD